MAERNSLVPENLERTEAILLGSLLLHPEMGAIVRSMLRPEDFSAHRHRLIYEAVLAAIDVSEPDAIVELLTERELQDLGGVPFLTTLKQQADGAEVTIEDQARRLRRGSLLRQFNEAQKRVQNYNALDDNIGQVANDLEQALSAARQLCFQNEVPLPEAIPLKDALSEYLAGVQVVTAVQNGLTGVPTGFADLDAVTGGMQRSDLVVVAGPPSVGKTGFALSIALHVLQKADRPVGLFSLEAPRRQVIERLLAMEAGLEQRLFHAPGIEGDQRDKLRETSEALMEGKLWIDDTVNLSTTQLRERAEILVKRRGVELVIVDYIHLMLSNINHKRYENRVQEVGEISRSLKALARELDVPVLAIAQLSRAFESRPTKRPDLSDLRDGALENDADLVLFLSVTGAEATMATTSRLAMISIAKNRHGPRVDLDICFHPTSTRFRDLPELPALLQPLSSAPSPARRDSTFPRLQEIMEQGLRRRQKQEIPPRHREIPVGRRELPRGYVFEDESEEGETPENIIGH